MSRYILVHGAWHGAWCWQHVVPLLEATGHTVQAIDLPGRGSNPAPSAGITFADYVGTMDAALNADPEPAIVVGHSLGGMSITAAAERSPGRITRLVYLAAFLPNSGQSALDIVAEPEMRFAEESLLSEARVMAEDGRSVSLRPEKLREVFFADCSDADVALARAHVCAEPIAAPSTPVEHTAGQFGSVSRDYVECTADRAVPLTAQRAMVSSVGCDRVFTLDTSHSPFFSAPERLVDILVT